MHNRPTEEPGDELDSLPYPHVHGLEGTFSCFRKETILHGGETRMPNAKVLAEKKAVVAELTEKLKNAASGVLVDYKGITVEDDTKLRAELRKNNVEYSVVKNTLTRFAAQEAGYGELDAYLNGTTALAISMDDAVMPAKLIGAFAKKSKTFEIKAGFVDGKVVDVATVQQLAELPSKEILLAMVLGTMNAPIASLARAIKAIAEQKGAPAEAPAEEAAAEAAAE